MSLQDYDLKKVALFIVVVVIIIASLTGIGSGIYFYNKYQTAQKQLRESSLSGSPQEDIKALVDKVGKLIKLPDGETPTVATVSNLDRLKDQPFFANAKVGDRVLLYTQAKKAILYDPFDNKIVEVGPLILPTDTLAQSSGSEAVLATSSALPTVVTTPKVLVDTSSDSTDPSPTPAKAGVKLALYNGTSKIGLTNSISRDLKGKYPEIIISDKSYATRDDYAKTIIIDISGKSADMLTKIAELVGAESSALPGGERKPSGADILLIVGLDKVK